MSEKLDTYLRKRRFDETPEPSGRRSAATGRSSSSTTRRSSRAKTKHVGAFVIQEHHARRLHYDFRLELDGTLKSWAVPKGPSLDPAVKRLAVHVEDHPVEYGTFEGEIPPGNYGAGSVVVWDRGTWVPEGDIDALEAYRAGKLKFRLDGEKLHGGWALVRSHMRGTGDKEQWLLIKERDDDARDEADYDVIAECPGSVLSAHRDTASARASSKHTAKNTAADKAAKANTRTRVSKQPAAKAPSETTRRAAAKSTSKPKSHATADANATASTAPAPRSKRSTSVAKPARPDIVSTRDTASLLELAEHPAIEHAVKAKLPDTLKPQLATLADAPPTSGEWTYEIKFDGYRVLARIDGRGAKRRAHLFTRAGNDWTDKFGKLPDAFAQLDVESAWIDGEAVVLDANGVPSFQALQNAFDASRPQDIVVYVFDIPFLNGYDLRKVPLVQRRAILHALIEESAPAHLRFSDAFDVDAESLLKSACDMSLEGVIGKRIDSPYTSTRSPNWIKLKCRRRQEFVIGGYTEPAGSRAAFGALLLGVYDEHGDLQYAGRVGTGFDAKRLRDLKSQLDRRERKTMPFASHPVERSRTPVHWVAPDLVAECEFAEWTQERIVRQASFISLRTDKPAKQIVRESPKPPAQTAPRKATMTQTTRTSSKSGRDEPTEVAGVRITHPDRIIDPSSKATKLDLVEYYASVADAMLPELVDRPIAIVRAPEDIGGELFFQKHSQKLAMPGVTQHPKLDPGHPALMSIDNAKALIGVAQMGTVEIHTWNARADVIEKPDRVIFDLDPDPSLGWDRMIEAAQLTHTLLDELGIVSFCKTSGGKGLHIVVPLTRRAGWDDVKAFAQAVSEHMAATFPDRFSAKMGPQNRKKKIFIDYLRNNRGSTTVATFSARARPGLGVSVPIAWDALGDTTAGDQWNIFNVHERLSRLKTDPWADFERSRQSLTAAIKKRLGMGSKR